jgi:hypothetical protein
MTMLEKVKVLDKVKSRKKNCCSLMPLWCKKLIRFIASRKMKTYSQEAISPILQ